MVLVPHRHSISSRGCQASQALTNHSLKPTYQVAQELWQLTGKKFCKVVLSAVLAYSNGQNSQAQRGAIAARKNAAKSQQMMASDLMIHNIDR